MRCGTRVPCSDSANVVHVIAARPSALSAIHPLSNFTRAPHKDNKTPLRQPLWPRRLNHCFPPHGSPFQDFGWDGTLPLQLGEIENLQTLQPDSALTNRPEQIPIIAPAK